MGTTGPSGTSVAGIQVVCQDLDLLAAFIEDAGDVPTLIERGRSAARQVIASLTRLSPDQRETAVHCHLLHYDQIMVDEPTPWEMIVNTTQATRHLPAHHKQLQNLRRQRV